MKVFLATTVNGMAHGLQAFTASGSELYAEATQLRALGFSLGQDCVGPVPLSTLTGVTVDFDQEVQALRLTAPLSALRLPTHELSATGRPAQAKPTEGAGLVLNYDLYGYRNLGQSATYSAFAEVRAFDGNSVLSTTMLTQAVRNEAADRAGSGVRTQRLDTTWSLSFPEQAMTLRVGDTFTGSLSWTRATRIGGVQLARNFGLQPYVVTTPLASFLGAATLPSTLDLYIDGIKQYTSPVPAGPFRLNALPTVNAAGNAQVVLTDALGRSQSVSFPLYDTARLLGEGVSDWSVEVGRVRQAYGLRSFDYAKPLLLSGMWRRGITDSFTLEAQAQRSDRLASAGLGAVWQLGAVGTASLALSRSVHEGRTGTQASATYAGNFKGLSVSFNGSRTTGDYADAAALHGSAVARSAARASLGYGTSALGNFSVGYLYQRFDDRPVDRYATLGWFKSLGMRASISAGVTQNLVRRADRGVYVNLSWSLDGTRSASVGLERNHDRWSASVNAQQSEPSDGGWGWRVTGRAAPEDRGGQAEAWRVGPHGRASIGVASGRSHQSVFAGASGALLWMDGHGFASRRIDDSFAVVSTDEVANVPVSLENRVIGETDARGVLLVTPLHAYQHNQVSIDPMRLPPNIRVERTQATVVPTDRGGARVKFALEFVRAALLVVLDARSRPLPPGTEITLNGHAETIAVGYEGQLYLEQLAPTNHLTAKTANGTCSAKFDFYPHPSAVSKLGPVVCHPD